MVKALYETQGEKREKIQQILGNLKARYPRECKEAEEQLNKFTALNQEYEKVHTWWEKEALKMEKLKHLSQHAWLDDREKVDLLDLLEGKGKTLFKEAMEPIRHTSPSNEQKTVIDFLDKSGF